MTAEYSVLYGVSAPMPGFQTGNMYRSCDHGCSSLVFVNKDGRLFWAFMSKMDKIYTEKDMPRHHFSQSDAHVKKFPDFEVGCNTKLTELWKNVTTSRFGVLEEAVMETWTKGRFVCVGDSVHKATVNVCMSFFIEDAD